LLHGFNSGPGQKAEEINAYLKEYHLDADYELIAPQLSYEPKKAIDEINLLIEEHQTGSVFVIGTSLGGFYTNYFRAKFRDESGSTCHKSTLEANPNFTSGKGHSTGKFQNGRKMDIYIRVYGSTRRV
jgi:hypothetical protein